MTTPDWTLSPDVRSASTLPAEFYREARYLELARERVFARCWHFVGDSDRVKVPGHVRPLTLGEGCLDEPIVLARDGEDRLHCLSNVCTHRGNIVVEGEGPASSLRCRYHGRRFGLDGRFLSMPGMEDAVGFPSPADDLPRVPFGSWGKFLFASVRPGFPLYELLREMRSRLAWLPLDALAFEPTLSRDYRVAANWALYCENYLEGLHIPFVHHSLAGALNATEYRTELYPYASLQLGVASTGGEAFDPPPSAPDHGRPIAAYYYWLFPNLMFNFYPWGLSLNVVTPLSVDRTRVSFLCYVGDRRKLEVGAGAGLDRVEREDEAIVEAVQRGVRSRFYARGRYSPRHEAGVHHFHRLLARFLAEP
ncbi:MAG: aromatic ring-hydroxylating dioxygenase subunit alpha [Planctomycetes bacterium]|nr:aromatic ring-hydroxylating dioxygenase subunit alpha [Planctomycetota bacterium]